MLGPYQHMLKEKKKRKKSKRFGAGERTREEMCEVFLPNRDLISEPEHTVCKDATGQGAAPFLPVGRLVL